MEHRVAELIKLRLIIKKGKANKELNDYFRKRLAAIICERQKGERSS